MQLCLFRQIPLNIDAAINKNIMRKLKEFIKMKAPFISPEPFLIKRSL